MCVLLVALGLASCSAPNDCTLPYIYGLSVYVSDRTTQAGLVDGQTVVVATDGVFVDTATSLAGTFKAAGGRPGRYTVTAERIGYQKWTQANVVVRMDGCQLEPVSLHARLQPTSP
jgi:hypothetical protein